MKSSKLFILVAIFVFLSFNATGYHQCYDTTVNHDTHYHGDGISGDEAYQDWHASFAQYRSHRGRSSTCGGSAPNYIDISDGDGNSDRVNNPGDNYRVWTSDYSWLQGGDQVTVYFGGNDGATSSSVTRTMPVPNEPPSFNNPDPEDGDLVSPGTTTLSVDVSDADGDSMDVDFYDASDGSLIGSDSASDGGTASTQWDVDKGETYNWYVVVDDGKTTVDNSGNPWTFETNSYPSVSNPEPNDGEMIEDYTPRISAEYNDPENDPGTLTYYDSNDNEIGSCSVSSGNRCSVEWSSADHLSNSWYAEASDGGGARTGPTWSFKINRPPDQPTLVNPGDGGTAYDASVQLEVEVTDPDNDDMDVEFFNNVSNRSSSERTVNGVNSGDRASVNFDNLNRGDHYSWWVKMSDGYKTTESSSWTFYSNDLPNAYDEDPPDGGINTPDSDATLRVGIVSSDPVSNDVTTYYYRGNGDYIGKRTAPSGEKTEIEYSGTEIGKYYEWYVKVSDGYENITTNTFEFRRLTSASYRVQPSIDYDYTEIIMSESGNEDIVFRVRNQIDDDKYLKTYLEGVNATFVENNKKSIEYVLEGGSEREFLVNINPDSTGTNNLDIITENQQFSINTSTSIPVTTKNYNDVTATAEVTGIGTIQLIMLLLVSAYLYSARL